MTLFITGATGYLGSYVIDVLMQEHELKVALLTRAKDRDEGIQKLWRSMQLHWDAETFYRHLPRIEFVPGDLTAARLGIDEPVYDRLVREVDSVLHIAASLNRNSEKACLNSNLRGTLAVVKMARDIADLGHLDRFSHVSTVAVAGHRDSETVFEDTAIDWDRKDYDPYGRTKKFAEHMVRELLPDTTLTFLRPSMVMGDSRFRETSQFDMLRATCILADLPAIPVARNARVDVVNADWVGRAIAEIHIDPKPEHEIYHLSAGSSSPTVGELCDAVASATGGRAPLCLPQLEGPFTALMEGLAGMKKRNQLTLVGALFKVFMPYITYDTVFDNQRAVSAVGRAPASFSDYIGDVYSFCKEHDFEYPHVALPARKTITDATSQRERV